MDLWMEIKEIKQNLSMEMDEMKKQQQKMKANQREFEILWLKQEQNLMKIRTNNALDVGKRMSNETEEMMEKEPEKNEHNNLHSEQEKH